MSVDERLRSALRDQADTFGPPVEAALERTRSRGRAARWRTAAGALVGTAAVAAAVVGTYPWLEVSGPRDTNVAVEPTATDPTTAAVPLRGGIESVVTAPDRLAGRWVLQLNGNGTMDVRPPAEFSGDVTGALFTADSSNFRTTLFQQDVCTDDGTGIYVWLRAGEGIEFDVVSDPCAARRQFFEESSWRLSTEGDPRG